MATRQCSKCGRSVLGHVGQCGDKCTMQNVSHDEQQLCDEEVSDMYLHALSLPPPSKQPTELNQHDVPVSPASMESNSAVLELTKQLMDMRLIVNDLSNNVAALRNGPVQVPTVATDSAEPRVGASLADTVRKSTVDRDRYLPNGTRIKETVYNKAINGEFIHLVDFVTCENQNEFETKISSDGTMQFVPRKSKKQLDTFLNWLQAWNNYESVIMSVKPELYSELLSYRMFIQSADRKYRWSAIYSYDMRFRADLARDKSWKFGTVSSDLAVSTLDATAVRSDVTRCFRCRSTEHVVPECPFPATLETKKPPAKPNKPQTPQHQGQDICFNFNRKRCTYPACRRAHVCQNCRGSRPYDECTCNPNKVPI